MFLIKNLFTLLTIVCLLLVVGMASAFTAIRPATTELPNFHVVAPNIYRGAAPTKQGLCMLKAKGVHTIIDLRMPNKLVKEEQARALAMGFTWIHLPMSGEPPTQQEVDTLLATLAKAPREPVFVHCQHGADRTGCMIGIYRVQVQHWTFAQAWPEMRRYGFNPHWTKLTEAVRSRATSPAHPG
jgi:protein tyrosine/serine phosphatase